MNAYFTVKKTAQTSLTTKRSKFISNVSPVASQGDAEAFIEDLKREYWNATHNVYAYSIGLKADIQKFSDAGEPSGTAGKPVLEAIHAMEIRNVVVVVTRYFGGILLGAGGLVRAYSDSAVAGLKAAKIIEQIKCDEYEIVCDYSLLGKLQWEFSQRSLKIKDTDFTQHVTLRVCVPVSLDLNFEEFVLNLSSGEAGIKKTGSFYMAF